MAGTGLTAQKSGRLCWICWVTNAESCGCGVRFAVEREVFGWVIDRALEVAMQWMNELKKKKREVTPVGWKARYFINNAVLLGWPSLIIVRWRHSIGLD